MKRKRPRREKDGLRDEETIERALDLLETLPRDPVVDSSAAVLRWVLGRVEWEAAWHELQERYEGRAEDLGSAGD